MECCDVMHILQPLTSDHLNTVFVLFRQVDLSLHKNT